MRAGLLLCHSTGARKQSSIHDLYTETNGDWATLSQTDWDSLEWARYSWNSIYIARRSGHHLLNPRAALPTGPVSHCGRPRNGRTPTPAVSVWFPNFVSTGALYCKTNTY